MAKNNSIEYREPATKGRINYVEESNRESQKNDQPKTRLEPGSSEWSRYWSLVFKRMK